MRVKICGLRSRGDVTAAVDAGAAYVGLVFFPPSPRHLTFADAAWVVETAPEGLIKVALTVDASDDMLDELLEHVAIDMIQLHGAESPQRVSHLRRHYRRPVMKAVGLAVEEDLAALADYSEVADQLLIDARPEPEADRPGGNGTPFDWRMLADWRAPVPWMLAGGLTPDNVAEAVRVTGARQVDVSSGVEHAPGRKDHDRMSAFVRAAMATGPAVQDA